MKYCLGVILYNPDESSVENIERYNSSGLFEEIILYDNSDDCHDNTFDKGLTYIRSGKNDGLSKPYNLILKKAIEENYDYLCLLDQDSNYEIQEMQKLMEFINNNSIELDNCAVIAPRTYVPSSKPVERGDRLTDVEYAINSGSFLNISCVKNKKLKYDENIFLDGVDWDFGWSARENGLRICVYEDSVFYQSIGYNLAKDNFSHHNAFRYYYIAHNKKYIYKKHLGNIKGGAIALLSFGSLLGKVLLYEDNKAKKMKNCIKGFVV